MATPCTSSSDCSDHGDCQHRLCVCDFGWFSEVCDQPGTATWGKELWLAFTMAFIAFFIVLLGLSLWKLSLSIKANNWMLGRIRRLLGSPKHLALLFICTHAGLRIFWLSVDPLRQYDLTTRVYDRLIFESAYPLVYSTFSCVLIVWGGLYQGVARLKGDKTRLLRWVLFVAMVLSFPVCLTISCVKGLRVNQQEFRIVGYALICIDVVIIMTGLVLFGRKLLSIAKELEEKETEQQQLLERSKGATRSPAELTAFRPDVSLNKTSDPEMAETPSFTSLEAVYRLRSPASLSFSYSLNPLPIHPSLTTESWPLSSLSSARHSDSPDSWSCLSTSHLEAIEMRPSTVLRTAQRPSNEYLVVLTEEDQAVLKQVRAP